MQRRWNVYIGIWIGLWLAVGLVRAQHPLPEAGLTLDEAVRTTLQRDLAIQRQIRQVRGSEGALTAAQGTFDLVFTSSLVVSRERSPLSELQQAQFGGITETLTDASAYELGLQRMFRSGLTIQSGLAVTRSTLDLRGPAEALADLPALPTSNTARLSVRFSQPLLRGRGLTATAAPERAAALRADAERSRLQQTTADRVLVAVTAYWAYVVAWQTHAIRIASEDRARRLFEETHTLIEADQRPAADLDQLRADLADKAAARVQAEQAVFAARQNLGRAMGLSHAESRRLSPPTAALPTTARLDFDALPDVEVLIDVALTHRADVQAVQAQTEATRQLRAAARRNRQAALDLDLSLGYTGLSQGADLHRYVSPLAENVGGLNVRAALRYVIPFNNRAAQGAYAQRQAAYDARRIAQDDLARQVALNVSIAYEDVAAGHHALRLTEDAIGHHRQALENERLKFQQGFSTLFNVILFQDRLTLAEAQGIAAQARLAVALATLRYEAGRLWTPDTPEAVPPASFFLSFPSLNE